MVLKALALIVACILAPVIAVAVGTLAFVGDFGPAGEYSLGWLGAAMIGAWLGIVIGMPTMLLVGLPLHVHFQRRGATGLTPYAIGGALAGVLASAAFMLVPMPGAWSSMSWSDLVSGWERLMLEWEISAKVLIFGALTGMLAAWIFWLLWRLRKPQPNPPTSAP